MKFKEGDRVRVSTKSGYTSLVGKTGMVYAVDPKSGDKILVKLDGWNNGHNGILFLASMGRDPEVGGQRDKWIFPEDDLCKIENVERDGKPQKGNGEKMKFKVGDRVEITKDDENKGQKGTIVEVGKYYDDDNFYLIRLDDTERGHSGGFYYVITGRDNPHGEEKTGYWMLFDHDMRLIGGKEGAKETGKKPQRRTVVIEITDDGAKARYFCGGKIPAKEAKVRRYRNDEPDDGSAAMFAVGKLFGRFDGQKPTGAGKDGEEVAKLKVALAEVEKYAVSARESAGEALYRLHQIRK